MALDYRRPPSWRVPALILTAVVLLAVGATAFAVKRIGDDAEREVSRTPVKVGEPSAGTSAKGGQREKKPATKKPAKEKPATKDAAARKRAQTKEAAKRAAPADTELVRRGALYSWPRELKAFTVVLLSAEDRQSAENFARSASKGAPAKLGVIRADDFKSLPEGFYIVFAGQYEDRAAADAAAARLTGRFSGAFPQLVAR